jgi:23S rRNA (uracil1939-C5)-methyltransferase
MILEISALDAAGHGIARRPDGKVAFVEGALAGERVEAEVRHARRKFDVARLVRVIDASAARREPKCPHFGACGGCATQHVDLRTQVAAKQRWLEDNLERVGKVKAETMLAPIYGEEWGYRRRARLSVRYVENRGGAMVGFRERRSTHVADLRSCDVLTPGVSALIVPLRELVNALSIRERIPQIEVAVGDENTVLVFRHLLPLSRDDEFLLENFHKQHKVHVWLQPKGPESAHPAFPQASSLFYALPEFGVKIAFGPTDFTQVNAGVNRMLVSRALRLLDPQPGERIADLFCGLGNFSLPLAARGAQVVGFEGTASLVDRARANAKANGLIAQFEVLDLFKRDLQPWGRFERLLLDPPREGAVELVKSLPDGWPRRILYVSCDPTALARDAGILVNVKGFRLLAAGVVNMFPHTAHVESIALFERD